MPAAAFGDVQALVDWTLKGSLLLLAALLALVAFKRLAPSLRHLILLCAVVGALLLPVLSGVLPEWDLAFLPEIRLPSQNPGADLMAFPFSEQSVIADPGIPNEADSMVPASRFPTSLVIVLIWVLGASALLLRLCLSFFKMSLVLGRSRPVQDPALCSLLLHVGQSRGSGIRLVESSRVSIPLVLGWRHPTIVFPEEASTWPEDKRRLVLLHELAHILRSDVLSSALVQAASILYWFNPLVWVALRRLYVERERACDDYVLENGTKASLYAAHLMDIASRLKSVRWLLPAGVALARKSSLEERVMSIINYTYRGCIPKKKIVFTAVLVTLFLVTALASVHAWIKTDTSPELVSSIQETDQSEEIQIRISLKDFYAAIRAKDYDRAVDFFAGVSQYEKSEMFPLALLNEESDSGHKNFSILSSQKLEDLQVSSEVRSVEKKNGSYQVTEALRITATRDDGTERPLVDNPEHMLTFVREDGTWKINSKAEIRLSIVDKPDVKTQKKVGLCFTPDGVTFLEVNVQSEEFFKHVLVNVAISKGDKVYVKKDLKIRKKQ